MKRSRLLLASRTALAVVALVFLAACTPEITSPATATAKVGEPFTYRIAAKHHPTSFSAAVPPPAGLSVDPTSGVISGTPTEAGDFAILIGAKNSDGEDTQILKLTVAPPPPLPPPPPPATESHPVVGAKELFITAPAVLNDARAQAGGPWHVKSALQRIAGPGADVEAFAQAWFATWTTNTALPGVTDPDLTPRAWVSAKLQEAWANDRIRLIAIVNRLDLTRFADADITKDPLALGEGRFVYEVRDSGNVRLPFTIIFEYGLPAPGGVTAAQAERWGKLWHALGRPALGNETSFPPAYLAELQAITDEYSATGTLNQIRTNEFLPPPAAARLWQLREFKRQGSPARLVQTPVAVTPAFVHNDTPALAGFINANTGAIESAGLTAVPAALQAAVSPVPDPGFKWRAAGATSARAVSILSFNTCSGCHAGDTGTLFQHIGANAPDLSPFLSGPITLDHPLPGKPTAQHDEMGERRKLLAALARDIPLVTDESFQPEDLNAILRSRANRPH